MKKRIMGGSILAIVIIVFVVFFIVRQREISQIREEAREYAESLNVDLTFTPEEDYSTQEGFLKELIYLAEWTEDTSDYLDGPYGFDEDEILYYSKQSMNGFESKDKNLKIAMASEMYQMQQKADDGVRNGIAMLFDDTDRKYGIYKDSVVTSWEREYFPVVLTVNAFAEDGSGLKAYEYAIGDIDEEWRALSMDIAYGLYPDVILDGCEASLKNAIEERSLYRLEGSIQEAEDFSERYNVDINALSRAKTLKAHLEYEKKPEIPKAGMSVSLAQSTKLGPPTRKTSDSQSWSGKKHTYGDMYWDKNGVQIFKAHYLDHEITEVWDTRNSKGSYHKRYSTGSSTSGSKKQSSLSGDPDDHDIEAYYEDNWDEYVDYEDAYDGFMDDEDAWDDY